MAIAKAQKAGLKTRPSCSLVMWKAALIALATSPRIAKDIDVVTSETALTVKSARLFIQCAYGALRPRHVQLAVAGLDPVRTARFLRALGRARRALQRGAAARRTRTRSPAPRPRSRRRTRNRARARHALDLPERRHLRP